MYKYIKSRTLVSHKGIILNAGDEVSDADKKALQEFFGDDITFEKVEKEEKTEKESKKAKEKAEK